MYVTIRRNSPCTFCSVSAGKRKSCTVFVGQKVVGERRVRMPVCPACVEGMKVFLDRFIVKRATRECEKLSKLIRGGSK